MPTDLLEHPTVVEDVPRVAPKTGSTKVDPRKDHARLAPERERESGARVKGVLHDIFEGHEEYLGWTPD